MQLANEFLRRPASTDPAESTADASYPLEAAEMPALACLGPEHELDKRCEERV